MGANPHANGGLLRRDLELPHLRDFAVDVPHRGRSLAEATRVLGQYLRDVFVLNAETRNFRIVGPDETTSNRLDAVFDVTDRVWMEAIEPYDVHLAHQGRVMEVLSEHLCQGWLEGYLLTRAARFLFLLRKPSSTSWVRWSTSMPNGSRCRGNSAGDVRFPR